MTSNVPTWLVVQQRETEPVEVTPFDDEAAARDFFDRARGNWSDTFLCRVVDGPKA